MTFKEKLQKSHPGFQPEQIERAITTLCPEDLGYEEKSPCVCLKAYSEKDANDACRKCWEREADG